MGGLVVIALWAIGVRFYDLFVAPLSALWPYLIFPPVVFAAVFLVIRILVVWWHESERPTPKTIGVAPTREPTQVRGTVIVTEPILPPKVDNVGWDISGNVVIGNKGKGFVGGLENIPRAVRGNVIADNEFTEDVVSAAQRSEHAEHRMGDVPGHYREDDQLVLTLEVNESHFELECIVRSPNGYTTSVRRRPSVLTASLPFAIRYPADFPGAESSLGPGTYDVTWRAPVLPGVRLIGNRVIAKYQATV